MVIGSTLVSLAVVSTLASGGMRTHYAAVEFLDEIRSSGELDQLLEYTRIVSRQGRCITCLGRDSSAIERELNSAGGYVVIGRFTVLLMRLSKDRAAHDEILRMQSSLTLL